MGSLTHANWVSFDFNVSYSSCGGYSLIKTLKLKKIVVTQNRRKCAEHLGIVNNKVGRGVVAHARRCAQTDSSAIKLALYLSLFSRTCVLGLCQNRAPHPKMVKRRVAGGGVQDIRSMKPIIRKSHLLITHILDSCVKLLAVLHISSAQGQSADRTSTGLS